MLSVIIPTMWKYEPFLDFFKELLDIECISEFIIINNNPEETPDHLALKHPKVKIHNSETNLYVNPSWNLGARLANNPNLAFLSDDFKVNKNVFCKVNDFMNNEEVGLIGILAKYLHHDEYSRFMRDDSIDIVWSDEPDSNKRPPITGLGNLFFVRKELWKDIPEEIKIFHGEILQWNRIYKFKKNYIITNCFAETPWHVTWKYLSEKDDNIFCKIQSSDQSICEKMQFIF